MLAGDLPERHRGTRIALETEDRAWSYEALDDLARGFADSFIGHGCKRGDRVSFVMGNDAPLVAAYFGAFRAGLVANPVNNRLKPEEVAYILDHAGSRYVVVSEEFQAVVEAAI